MTTMYFPSEKEKIYRKKVLVYIQDKKSVTNKEIRSELKIGWAMATRILDYLETEGLINIDKHRYTSTR